MMIRDMTHVLEFLSVLDFETFSRVVEELAETGKASVTLDDLADKD